MDASRSKRLMTLAVAALFLASVVPALAAGEFDLQLEAALSDLGDDLSAEDLDLEPASDTFVTEPIQVASLNSEEITEMWRSTEAVSAQTTGGSGGADKSWWKKKKWWIPVVVAVVAGAALSDGDGDSNIDDEED